MPINPLKTKDSLLPHEEQIIELTDLLAILLSDNPQGLPEHQLLKLLQQAPHEFFASDALRDPLLLFQTHFLLFHCLYNLKQRWAIAQQAELEISVLLIIKRPFIVKETEKNQAQPLLQSDPLAQYYLDWSHFSTTTEEDVETLLNSFWRKVFNPQTEDNIQQSLAIMQLDVPVSTVQLKIQYRRLAQIHHPDKGGDSEHFKKICQAFHQLKQYNLLSHKVAL
jgi:hypothetical protein